MARRKKADTGETLSSVAADVWSDEIAAEKAGPERLSDQLVAMLERVAALQAEFDQLSAELSSTNFDNTDLDESLISLREVKKLASDLRSLQEQVNNERKFYETSLHHWMLNRPRPIEGHKTDGSNFVPQQTEYANVQDLDEFVAWAQENDPSLLKQATRDGELNKLVRERLDNGEPLPPGLGFYVREIISVRAA